MKAYRYIRNGESLSLDEKACTGCGLCLEVCPHAVFGMVGAAETAAVRGPGGISGGASGAAAPASGRKARIDDRGLCMECGACAMNCPAGAIAVKSGVGCAAAIIIGKLRGTAPDCGGCCGAEEGGESHSRSRRSTTGCC
jgi:NAD-dependent dihydropyrimidine dehydrogenase PreA subunit